jgi:hypothetical protein
MHYWYFVPPVILASYIAYCWRKGSIYTYGVMRYRAKTPISYWSDMALAVFIFCAMLLPIISDIHSVVSHCDNTKAQLALTCR